MLHEKGRRAPSATCLPAFKASSLADLMAPLGALSQAWTSVEASLPHGWQLAGLYRFDETWIALSEGPEFDDYLSGSGLYAEQALRNLGYRLRERRGPVTG